MPNSRKKGAKNEREIAKALEKWTGRKFAKTPASGGLRWQAAMSKGDVVCTTEGHYFPFCIEGKFYVEIDFSHLLTPGIVGIDILDWWKQCRRDAEKCNKVPMLLMRYNRLPKRFWFMVLPWKFYCDHLIFTEHWGKTVKHIVTYENKDLPLMFVIIRSTEFFKLPYLEIKKIAKIYTNYGKKEKGKKG